MRSVRVGTAWANSAPALVRFSASFGNVRGAVTPGLIRKPV